MTMPDEPYRLAMSDDGALLYVGNYDIAPGTVRRIDLATKTVDLQFQVGSIPQDFTFPMVPSPGVSGIAVLPGSPHTIVAVLTDLMMSGAVSPEPFAVNGRRPAGRRRRPNPRLPRRAQRRRNGPFIGHSDVCVKGEVPFQVSCDGCDWKCDGCPVSDGC